MVNSLHPSEVARLLESLPLKDRAILWEIVDSDISGDVLVELAEDVRDGLIEGMATEELIAAAEGMEVDDLADLLADLPETVTQQVLQSLDKQDHERLEQVLAYDEESAGGTDERRHRDRASRRHARGRRSISARSWNRCRTARIRFSSSAATTRYIGSLFLSRLLTHDPEEMVANVMSTDIDAYSGAYAVSAGCLGVRES